MDAGIRELKNGLSRYLDEVRKGHSVTVTDHGKPIARLVPLTEMSPLDRLIAEGLVQRARKPKSGTLPDPIVTAGTVSDLVGDQRR